MRQEASGPFEWGMGPLPTAIITTLVMLLVLSNVIALFLSIPSVAENAPKIYGSELRGEFELPFIPDNGSGLRVHLDDTLVMGEPFDITVEFTEGRCPLTYQMIIFSDPSGRIIERNLWDIENEERTGSHFVGCRIPALDASGTWTYGLYQGTGKGKWTGPYIEGSVNVSEPDGPRIWPELDRNGSFSGSLVFRTFVFDDSNSSFSVRLGSGEWMDLEEGSDRTLLLSELAPLGAYFEITVRASGSAGDWTARHLVCKRGADPSSLYGPQVMLERTLYAQDELFDQTPEGPINVGSGEIELYVNSMYNITMMPEGDPRGSEVLSDLFGYIIPFPRYRAVIGPYEYNLPWDIEKRSAGTILRIPAEVNDTADFGIELFVETPFGSDRLMVIDVRTKEDHSPFLELRPDPYILRDQRSMKDIEVRIIADWELVTRKDFSGEPSVFIDDEPVELRRNEEFFEDEYTGIISVNNTNKGASMIIDVEQEFRFETYLSLLLPLPGVIYGIPSPISGYGAVIWFLIVGAAIIVSVGYLLYSDLSKTKGFGLGEGQGNPFWSFRDPNSPTGVTTRTYIAAYFFFWGTFILFQLFEQPTPVPGILSSETPIWIRMILLADASVWEEVSGRVVLIGLPLMVYHTVKRRKEKGYVKLQWRQLFGGTGRFGALEISLIIFSGALFGLAHLGWGSWKVVPTFVHGLMFGYLFIRVGLHASIIMHFLFDYSGFLGEIIGFEVPLFLMVYLVIIFLGGLCFAEILLNAYRWLGKRFSRAFGSSHSLLLAHAFLSLIFGLLLLSSSEAGLLAYIFLGAPLIDLMGFILNRNGAGRIGRPLVFAGSFFTLALAPIGMAWILANRDQGSSEL